MTFTIDTTPETEALLQQEAVRRGASLEEVARTIFAEALEDLEDVADARNALSASNPQEWRSLDELRSATER